MIREINSTSKLIPHISNIRNIHKNQPIINSINEFSPFFAGGYPMSLLFAPREGVNSLKIKDGYYSDYDIYFQNIDKLHAAKDVIYKLYESEYSISEIDTDNAITLSCTKGNDKVIQLQLIKKCLFPPEQILPTFDFVNCAVGYCPAAETFYVHGNAINCHHNRKLEILDPWMLKNLPEEINEENISNIIIQIARFKKYCIRWDYTLSDKSYELLLSIYNQHPNIVTSKNVVYNTSQGYNGLGFIARENQNIWLSLGELLRSHPLWSSSVDEHGIISGNKNIQSQSSIIVEEHQTNLLSTDAEIPF